MKLQTDNLAVGYAGSGDSRVVAHQITTDVRPGRLVCLVGPNGSGKSTLLRTLAGMQKPIEGTASISGRNVASLSPRDKAALLSVVLTDRVSVGYLTAREVVSLGRHPHTDWRGRQSARDRRVVESVMAETGSQVLADRHFVELSDGEKQKVMIARALAQATPVVILDEPTAYLDVGGRVEILELLQRLAHDGNRLVLVSTHDLDLAIKTADVVWVLVPGARHPHGSGDASSDHAAPSLGASGAPSVAAAPPAVLVEGAPEDLVLQSVFDCAFSTDRVHFDQTDGSFAVIRKPKETVHLVGSGVRRYWTERALRRVGITVGENGATPAGRGDNAGQGDKRDAASATETVERRRRDTRLVRVEADHWLIEPGKVRHESIGDLIEALRAGERDLR